MGYYHQEEVIAICDDNHLFHLECYDGNMDEIEEDQVITKNRLDEEILYFCDKCEKRV